MLVALAVILGFKREVTARMVGFSAPVEVIDGAGYALRPDTLFVIHPDDVTRFELAGDSEIEICNILFLPELIAFGAPLLADYPDFMRIFDLARKPEVGREQRERLYIQKADKSIAALIRAMLREFNQAQANYRSVIRLQLLELLCRIARQSDRKIRRSRGRAVAEQAADFLREHHSEPLEPAALAARFRAAQNSTLTRTAIRSAVLLVLQDYRARGWLSAFGDLRVYADAGDASLCRVEFTYSIPAGLHRIALSAQMTG